MADAPTSAPSSTATVDQAAGGAIIITVLGFLLVGDGLRDALDVKDT